MFVGNGVEVGSVGAGLGEGGAGVGVKGCKATTAVAATLPNRGLTDDHAHLTTRNNNDYTDPETFTRGYPMSDLSALVALDAVWRVMSNE